MNQEGHEAGFAQTVREFGTKWPPIRGTRLANTHNTQIPKTCLLTVVAVHLNRVVSGVVAIRLAVGHEVDHQEASGSCHL